MDSNKNNDHDEPNNPIMGNNNNFIPDGNVSYEKYNRDNERRERSPNKKIQVVIDKNNKQAIQNMYEVLESSPTFGYCLRLKRVSSSSDERVGEKKKLKVQISTHKKSNVVLQTGVDGFEDTLIINSKAEPYTYKDDETLVCGDFSSSDDNDDWSSEDLI